MVVIFYIGYFDFSVFILTIISLEMKLNLNKVEETDIVRLGRVIEGFCRNGATIQNNTK